MVEELSATFDELFELFTQRKFTGLRMLLIDMEAYDISTFMEERLDEKEKLVFFRILPKELASDVFVETDSDTQEKLIKAFTDKELKEVIGDMFLDDTVDIIEEMPSNVVKRILKSADPEDRKLINELLEYPDDSAGSIMTPEYVSLTKEMTVGEAFTRIRRTGVNKETIYTAYVTDKKRKLVGVVSVRTLLLADTEEKIEDIMDTNIISVETLVDKEVVATMFQNYDFLALPVIDKEGCIVGIVTVDDAVDVIQEEATEDIQKMAAMLPTDKPYLKQSTGSMWISRLPWLLLLMISATFTSMIIGSYESKLAAQTFLYACVPMIMGTGGNAGSQSSATIIRSLALGDVSPRDVLRIMWKELRVSILLGLTVAVACFAKLMLIDRLYNDFSIMVAVVISLAMFVTIIIAKIVGCLLPLFAKWCRLDPAVVASPFITTIVDTVSLLIYFGFAVSILGI